MLESLNSPSVISRYPNTNQNTRKYITDWNLLRLSGVISWQKIHLKYLSRLTLEFEHWTEKKITLHFVYSNLILLTLRFRWKNNIWKHSLQLYIISGHSVWYKRDRGYKIYRTLRDIRWIAKFISFEKA